MNSREIEEEKGVLARPGGCKPIINPGWGIEQTQSSPDKKDWGSLSTAGGLELHDPERSILGFYESMKKSMF